MSLRHFDVVIVGAGPAGSAAAIRMRQADSSIRVALVDKADFPRDKACGDGLGPGVVPQLMSLGIDVSNIKHVNRIKIAEVHGPGNLSFCTGIGEASSTHAYGVTARRLDFDYLLVKRAQETGVDLIQNTRFLDFHSTRASNQVRLKDTATGRDITLECKLLVGADGANSRVRRAANIKPNPAKQTGIAIRSYAKLPSHSLDRIILSFEDSVRPGYGWCFPFADGTVNVGVGMVISDYRKMRPDLKDLLQSYIDRLKEHDISLTDISHFSTYTLPHGGVLPRLVGERFALVGDAASMINPLSGEGIVYGLCASEILAGTIASRLSNPIDLRTGLRDYERRFRSEFRFHLWSNYAAHRLLRSRLWARMVIGGASIDPKLQATAIDFMFGKGHLTVGTIHRIIKYGIRYLRNG